MDIPIAQGTQEALAQETLHLFLLLPSQTRRVCLETKPVFRQKVYHSRNISPVGAIEQGGPERNTERRLLNISPTMAHVCRKAQRGQAGRGGVTASSTRQKYTHSPNPQSEDFPTAILAHTLCLKNNQKVKVSTVSRLPITFPRNVC